MTVSSGANEDTPNKYSWNTLQDRLRASVVSISISFPIPFDTESNSIGYATGFVVDADQGIILSNRHVMGPGPSSHKATFFDNQEVFLQPTYYDPEHDFSFFRYDPAELKGIEPRAIRLAPEKAHSGLEIRVVGNNSNEKMSVHQGELSQLDRNAPVYDRNPKKIYNDINTFYYQASTTSEGGSSGSPVVDIAGDAVAIKAGGNRAASNYMMPLQPVKYAFDYIRRGEIPPRGTLQAVFRHMTHVQAERLGLEAAAAASEGVCADESTGVLIVHKVVPNGPADGVLQVGDIMIGVNGAAVPGFPELFGIIDAEIGCSISMRVFRKSQFITVHAMVQDLYEIMPTRTLNLGNCYLHDLSFQEAASGSAPVTGVKISMDATSLFPSHETGQRKVIHAINYQITPNLNALIQVLRSVHRGQPLVVTVKDFHDPRDEAMFVTYFPQVTAPILMYTRSIATGFWAVEPVYGLIGAPEPKLGPALSVDYANLTSTADDSFASRVQQCMVWIETRPVCPADGQYAIGRSGTGLVVDPKRGLVLCSTRLLPNPTSNISATFGSARANATLAYIHPLYPVAFVKYDPALLADIIPDLGLLKPDRRLGVGDPVTVFAGTNSQLKQCAATVSGRQLLTTTPCESCLDQVFINTEKFLLSPTPTPMEYNIGVVCVNDQVRGVLLSLPECFHCTYTNKYFGFDIALVLPALSQLRASDIVPNSVRVLDVEFSCLPLATARAFGVSAHRLQDILHSAPETRSVLKVCRILHIRPADMVSLEIGDIVLQINGRNVEHIDDVACFDCDLVQLTIIRQGRELVLSIPTTPFQGANTNHIVYWAGMYFQQPYHTVLQQATRPVSNVYVFTFTDGSPIAMESFHLKMFVSEISKNPINTLDDVVRVAKLVRDPNLAEFNKRVARNEKMSSGTIPGRDVIIHIVMLNGEDVVKSFRTNDQYFPAWQLHRGPRIDDNWVLEEF
ncbi:hypothetical protein GGF49_004343 [Coemansia sp. RSA 1853]|nr:hypothetical protein LPJ76_005358 [Coemansia sp. RSA 638]KAJ2540598.1 hypothetical protein GGF49_004343 [Coemansia sp. RSA 1853]